MNTRPHTALALAAVVALASPARAADAPIDPGMTEERIGATHAQMLMADLGRERCSVAFPADAARYAAQVAAWLEGDRREIAVAERSYQLLIGQHPELSTRMAAVVGKGFDKMMAAPDGKPLEADVLHARCDRFMKAIENDELRARLSGGADSLKNCEGGAVGPCADTVPLAQAKRGFATAATPAATGGDPLPKPPAGVFELVRYPTAAGPLPAFRTPATTDGKRRPAIVWITGGDTNTIGDVWSPARRDNDQTAAAYRQAGIVMMFPSLRGGNTNAGTHEGFYGEVDDVLAAADWLAAQPDVDPTRVYLGGHSTGGTLALLTAEVSSRFRAVFAFGPVANAVTYGKELVPVDPATADPRETTLRSPSLWLAQVGSETFVIEGEQRPANVEDFRLLRAQATNPRLHFLSAKDATHFSVLAPANALIAQRILADGRDSSGVRLARTDLDAAIAAAP